MSLSTQPGPGLTDWEQTREMILERDKYRCQNCHRPKEVVNSLHVDHVVPRRRGGADRAGNLQTLCGDCHAAKHGEGYPPLVEFDSSGLMDDYTFQYYRHFFSEIVPALGRQVGTRVQPKEGLKDHNRVLWAINLGDVQCLDACCASADSQYTPIEETDLLNTQQSV